MRKDDWLDYAVNFMGLSEKAAQNIRLVVEIFTVLALLAIVWFLMDMAQNSQYCKLVYLQEVNKTCGWLMARPLI